MAAFLILHEITAVSGCAPAGHILASTYTDFVNPIKLVDIHNLASWKDEQLFIRDGDPDKV